METKTPAHDLETQLARVELENAIYKLSTLADKARRNCPKLAQIAADLSSEISEKLGEMQAIIIAKIESEQAESED